MNLLDLEIYLKFDEALISCYSEFEFFTYKNQKNQLTNSELLILFEFFYLNEIDNLFCFVESDLRTKFFLSFVSRCFNIHINFFSDQKSFEICGLKCDKIFAIILDHEPLGYLDKNYGWTEIFDQLLGHLELVGIFQSRLNKENKKHLENAYFGITKNDFDFTSCQKKFHYDVKNLQSGILHKK